MLDFLLDTKEGLITFGVALAIIACAMPRWHSVFFALLAIPLLGFTLGLYEMFVRPPEDQAPIDIFAPVLCALWPAVGAVAVAAPLLVLRRVGEMIFPKCRAGARASDAGDSRG